MEETMRYPTKKARSRALLATSCAAILTLLGSGRTVQAADVTVPGTTDFPESLTAAPDGSLIFGSFAGGRLFKAAPGATEASEWIKPGTAGLSSVLGVLADAKSGNLYVCSDDLSGAGITVPTGATPPALKVFDLKTGAPKTSIALPPSTLLGQTALCNDIVVAADGTVYVTDTFGGHVLRLKPGAKELEIWAHDARWDVKGPQLDGIAILPDGAVYANIFEGDGLYRIAVNSDGSAGKITKLETSRPLYHSDGLRAFGPDKLIQVEGETKGTLDLITVSGDTANIETIKGGFEGPVSLVQVGDVAYVLDVPLKYLFDPEKKKQTPPPFKASPVKLP
jgi:sugar lactone lactonase YvrE